jgi:HlyD family secretion protein
VKYRLGKVTRGDVLQAVSANGTLNPVVLVNVGTQVSGTVKRLRADFNDHVVAGQVLLELDPALLQAQVRQDEANLADAIASRDLAQVNEKRSLTLWDQDSIARQEVDTAVQATAPRWPRFSRRPRSSPRTAPISTTASSARPWPAWW